MQNSISSLIPKILLKKVKGYEEDWRILLLWDFDVDQILSANTSGVAAVIPDTDDICVTPLLDVNAEVAIVLIF